MQTVLSGSRGNGYRGNSKSYNAIYAEDNGRYPKTTFKKVYGVDPSTLVETSEWHHTSAFYRFTYYYSIQDVLEVVFESGYFSEFKKFYSKKLVVCDALYNFLKNADLNCIYSDCDEEDVVNAIVANLDAKLAFELLTKLVGGEAVNISHYFECPFFEWDKEGNHKETGTKYDERGFDKNGYNAEGRDREGYDVNGYDMNGLNKRGLTKAQQALIYRYELQHYEVSVAVDILVNKLNVGSVLFSDFVKCGAS